MKRSFSFLICFLALCAIQVPRSRIPHANASPWTTAGNSLSAIPRKRSKQNSMIQAGARSTSRTIGASKEHGPRKILPAARADTRQTGIGWYRKKFNVPENWNSKRIFAEFDGVFDHSDVWVNGEKVGHNEYGYIGFECDLTPWNKIRQGKCNRRSRGQS